MIDSEKLEKLSGKQAEQRWGTIATRSKETDHCGAQFTVCGACVRQQLAYAYYQGYKDGVRTQEE